MAFEPGNDRIFITEKGGTMKFYDMGDMQIGTVSGMPTVDYGGQGGLGDIAFAPDYATSRRVYLTWVEAGPSNTRGAVAGRGTLSCSTSIACSISGLSIIWRQTPKVTGNNHYSHKMVFSPGGQYLFITSGDRQLEDPAQDLSNTLGTFVRLNLDGSPASGNPFAAQGSPTNQIWTYGHRNALGIAFDLSGRLWGLEHGPAGGDELNLIDAGDNYGWPIVSDGDDYDGTPIPDHSTRPEFHAPAISWNPVIAPGDMMFYRGNLFAAWRGQVLIAGLRSQSIIRVSISGTSAVERARYRFSQRLRDIAEAPDGAVWLIEDGTNGRLLRLTPG